MDAVKFLKEEARMCKVERCEECGVSDTNNGKKLCCSLFKVEYPEEYVAIVQAWSKANPQKTYAEDFFEKFPNAPKRDNGMPRAEWCEVYENKGCAGDKQCLDCWDMPYEEDKP